MTELVKELLAFYKEKTKLPIVSTYVILLIVWNWDILSLYLFSSVNMETRICWIKNIVPGFWDHICRVLVPAVFAFLYPIVTKKLTLWNNNLSEKTDEDLFTQTKIKRINNAKTEFAVEEEKTGKKDLETLRVEKEALQNKVDDLTSKLGAANKLNEEFKDLDRLTNKSIKTSSKRPKDINIDDLNNEGLFAEIYDTLMNFDYKPDHLVQIHNNYNRFGLASLSEDLDIQRILLEHKIIKINTSIVGTEKYYEFSKLGDQFIDYIRNNT